MGEQAKKNGGIGKWFREMRSEIKKIVWPDRKQTLNNTIIVLASIFAVGAIVFLFDLGLDWLRDILISLA